MGSFLLISFIATILEIMQFLKSMNASREKYSNFTQGNKIKITQNLKDVTCNLVLFLVSRKQRGIITRNNDNKLQHCSRIVKFTISLNLVKTKKENLSYFIVLLLTKRFHQRYFFLWFIISLNDNIKWTH